MSLAVHQDSSVASASAPDGSASFPLNFTGTATVAVGPLPTGATALANSSGNVAAAAAVATLTSAAGRTAYISGFELTAAGSTTALPVVATVAGLLGGTLSYIFVFPAGVLIAAQPLIVEFNPPLPASAVNTNIVVTLPSGGAANTNAAASAHGYLI